MALNPNHTFEDLGDVKCAVVEKNCTPERVDFVKGLLELNGFEVVVVKSPPPKAAKPAPAPKPAPPPPADGTASAPDAAVAPEPPPPPPVPEAPPPPDTFTIGVTDLTFSPINAVFNRELKTADGLIVTSAYWKQQEAKPRADEWYWRK
jgi:type IV secretory pathway VirB10-like protein